MVHEDDFIQLQLWGPGESFDYLLQTAAANLESHPKCPGMSAIHHPTLHRAAGHFRVEPRSLSATYTIEVVSPEPQHHTHPLPAPGCLCLHLLP